MMLRQNDLILAGIFMIFLKALLQIPLIVCLIQGTSYILGRDEWWIVLPSSYLILAAYDFAEYLVFYGNDTDEEKNV